MATQHTLRPTKSRGLAVASALLLLLASVPGSQRAASSAGPVTVVGLPAGVYPGGLKIDAVSRRAYLTELDTKRLRVIDIDSRSTVALAELGTEPGEPTLTPDGSRVYLNVSDAPRIRILDSSTLQTVDTIDTSARDPLVVFPPDALEFFITDDDAPALQAVDPATKGVVAQAPIGSGAWNYTVSPDGSKIFVACEDGPDDYHTNVYVVDRQSFTVTSVIATEGGGGAAFAFSPDGSKLYLARPENSTCIQMIDIAAEQLDPDYPEGIALPDEPRGIWVNESGTRAYVALGRYDGAGRLAVVNLTTRQLITLVDLPDLDMVSDGAYIPDLQEVWLVQPGPMVELEDGTMHRTGDGRIVIVDVNGL